MSTIWEDDFESGDAIGVSYVGDVQVRTASGCGVGGSWGMQTYGDAQQQFTGEVAYYIGAGFEREYIRVRITLDHAGSAYTGEGEYGWDGITVYDSVGFTCGVYHGVGESVGDRSVIYVWSHADSGYTDLGRSAVGTITPGSFQVIELQVWMSTPTTPGGSTPNSDGRMKVTVDGATVIDVTGIKVMSRYTKANGGPNRVEGIYFAPMGNADNVGIYDEEPSTETWVDIPNWHAHEYLDASRFPNGAARCQCALWTEDPGTSPLPTITARLVSLLTDGSIDAEVGRSATITATDPTDATFAVTLVGNKAHKAQVTSDTTGIDLFCAPGAKVVP